MLSTRELGYIRPAIWYAGGLTDCSSMSDVRMINQLRGHRIEPAEIETALRDCAGVRDAFIVARKNEGGSVRLLQPTSRLVPMCAICRHAI